MPQSSETASLLGDYHRIGGVTTPRSAYGSSDSATTPRSPFDTGFPMMFNAPAPSPRPHRLSFAHTKDDSSRDISVFFALLTSVVSAGLLTIPFTFVLVPTWLAMLGLVFVGVAMAFSATALLNTHVALSQRQEETMYVGAGKRFTSFQSLAVLAGGQTFGYIVSAVTALGIYGGCVGAIRIVRDLSPFVLTQLYALATTHTTSSDSAPATTLAWTDAFVVATFLLVVFPLCLVKNLSGLRLASGVAFGLSLYVVAAVVYQSIDSGASSSSATLDPVPSTRTGAQAKDAPVVLTGSFARFTQCIALYTYAFMMHLNLLPLFIQLRGSFAAPLHKSRRKMSDYIVGVTAVCVVLYALLGVCATKRFGALTRGDVLLNLMADTSMVIPLLGVFLASLAGFPLLFQPLRSVLEELVYATNSAELPFATRLGGTSALLLTQLLFGILAPGIDVVFALTGATSCVLLCFVFPAGMYTQLFPWQTARGGKASVIALWSLAAVFSVLGAVATWCVCDALRRH